MSKYNSYGLLNWDMSPMECMGGYTSASFLKQCDGYSEAKTGDVFAAKGIFEKCVKKECMKNIREKYPDSILLPVMSHTNALPLSFAMHRGLPVCTNAWIDRGERRKEMNAMQRILNSPTFQGYIQPNKSYILVDDVVTQGGTIMALRQFVLDSGGQANAAVAIAYIKSGKTIIPTYENIDKFYARFGDYISDLFYDFIFPFESVSLSNSQVQYLLKFSSVEQMRKKAMSCYATAKETILCY